MPVVIDGNNLLHAARDADALKLLTGRSMLCDTVGRWAVVRRERVHIVFDGRAPHAALAKQIGNAAIEVSYSGAGRTADAVVTYLIDTDSAPRRLTVVSSDRAIIRAAKRRRARWMRSEDFWRLLKRDLAQPAPDGTEPEEKEAGLSPEATEEWLADFGFDGPTSSRPECPPGADE